MTSVLTPKLGLAYDPDWADPTNINWPFLDGVVQNWSAVLSPAALAADRNDYNPAGLAAANVLRLTASVAVSITGLQTGAAGRLLAVHNVGANNITLKDEDAGSAAANRLALPANLLLGPDHGCFLQYDVTSARWRVPGASPSMTQAQVLARLSLRV